MTLARRSLPYFIALLALPSWAAAPDSDRDIVVHVLKDGPHIAVDVDCPVEAPASIVWDVLTDYDHMAEFVSNVAASAIVERREGNILRVHQKGKASFGPFSLPFDNVREIELVAQHEIRSRLVSGDFKASAFTTKIEEVNTHLHIVNSGRYTPNMWVPPLIGPAVIESETRKQFGEIRAEILRRSARQSVARSTLQKAAQ